MPSQSSQPQSARGPGGTLSGAQPPRVFRDDIEGLRGFAIALVVFFHVFVGRVSSGVDVFLFVGGVFFFGPQIRNALNPQGLTLPQALVRMLRRLFPALVTVVLATFLLAIAVYPRTRWGQVGQDAVASLAYVQNLALAKANTDYTAVGRDVSVYQHLWSMSVQLQIYVGSLVIVTALAYLLRRFGWARQFLYGLVAAATAASFAYAAHLHVTDQGWNYYSPLSRFWEIGLGGLFGIWVIAQSLPTALDRWRTPTALVGLALIIGTGLFLDGAQQFPGAATLVPLGGAALVILAGNPAPARPCAARRALESAPLQFLGRVSYSLYLWHWPLLVLATYHFSSDGVRLKSGMGIFATLPGATGLAVGTAVIAASLALAWATQRLVETPLRQRAKPAARSWLLADAAYLRGLLSAPRGMQAAAGGIVAAAVAVFALNIAVQPRNVVIDVADLGEDHPGPDALTTTVSASEIAGVSDIDPIPDPNSAVQGMYPATDLDGCAAQMEQVDPVLTHHTNQDEAPCVYGDTQAARTMYLYGNSHAEQMLPAVDKVARARGIKVIVLVKMSCYPAGEPVNSSGDPYPQCQQWREASEKYILDNPPTDGVYLISTRPQPSAQRGPETFEPDLRNLVGRFNAAGIHVWAQRDTPWPYDERGPIDVRECAASDAYSALDFDNLRSDCGMPRELALLPENPAVAGLDGLDVTHVDLSDRICTAERCPGVVGNVLVYRDSSHLTNVYSEMLAVDVDAALFPDS